MDLCIDSFHLAEAPGEMLIFFFVNIHRSVMIPEIIIRGWQDPTLPLERPARQIPTNSAQILDNTTPFAMFFQVTLASEGIFL
jgi:hypothetical protein